MSTATLTHTGEAAAIERLTAPMAPVSGGFAWLDDALTAFGRRGTRDAVLAECARRGTWDAAMLRLDHSGLDTYLTFPELQRNAAMFRAVWYWRVGLPLVALRHIECQDDWREHRGLSLAHQVISRRDEISFARWESGMASVTVRECLAFAH